MKGDRIRYRYGYKYQLVNDYSLQTAILPSNPIETEFISLTTDGVLTIRHGYAWDGPSGPTIDTPDFMRGSLVHDAIYQLIRDVYLETRWRDDGDRELRRICLEDGMSESRASAVFYGVRIGGGSSAKPGTDGGKPLMEAP